MGHLTLLHGCNFGHCFTNTSEYILWSSLTAIDCGLVINNIITSDKIAKYVAYQ